MSTPCDSADSSNSPPSVGTRFDTTTAATTAAMDRKLTTLGLRSRPTDARMSKPLCVLPRPPHFLSRASRVLPCPPRPLWLAMRGLFSPLRSLFRILRVLNRLPRPFWRTLRVLFSPLPRLYRVMRMFSRPRARFPERCERPCADSVECHEYCATPCAHWRLPPHGVCECFTAPSCSQLPTSRGSCA